MGARTAWSSVSIRSAAPASTPGRSEQDAARDRAGATGHTLAPPARRRPVAAARNLDRGLHPPSRQARAAITRALGSDLKRDLATLLPTGIYTIPEVGTVGATEESLRAAGIDYVAGRWRAADNPRGCILGDGHGLLKLPFRRSDMRLLSVHVIGEQATKTVHVGMIAMLADGDADLFNRPASTSQHLAISTSTRPTMHCCRYARRIDRPRRH